MLTSELSRSKFRYSLDHLIREAADIEDVFSLLCLRRTVRLQINADEPRVRTSRLEPIPLNHRRRASRLRARSVEPGLVVGHINNHIALRAPLIQINQWSTAVRAARRQRRELRRISHHAISRIQFDGHQPVVERDNLGVGILPQYRCCEERSDINASNGRGRTTSIAGDRRMHRTGHVGQNVNLAYDRRHVLERNLHRVLQRLLHNTRYPRISVRVRNHELVRERSRLSDSSSIPQPLREDLCDLNLLVAPHLLVAEYAMPREGVEIHPSGLPWRIARDLDPVRLPKRQRGKHRERHLRNLSRLASLESLVASHELRQRLDMTRPTDQVGVQSFAARGRRLWMNHLDHVAERRTLSYRRGEQCLFASCFEPSENHPLGRAAERLPPGHARTNHLDKVPQHLRVVDHSRKNRLEQLRIAPGKHGAEQGRRILHPTLLTTENRRLGDELGINFAA